MTFDEWFKAEGGGNWGVSREELVEASFKSGTDGGDIVLVTPKGSEMTRYMVDWWLRVHPYMQAAWDAARKPEVNTGRGCE